MEQLMCQFYDELKEYLLNKNHDYELEMMKKGDTHYVFGDHLELMDSHNIFHGGTTHNSFLLFVNIRLPHIVSVYEWKNGLFSSLDLFTFVENKLSQLLNKSKYNGLLDVLFEKHSIPSREPHASRFAFCNEYIHYLSLLEKIPKLNPRMGPAADQQWWYLTHCKFWIHVTPEGLALSHHKNFLNQKVKTEEELKGLLSTLNLKEGEMSQLSSDLESLSKEIDGAKWIYSNQFKLYDKMIIRELRIVIEEGEFKYAFDKFEHRNTQIFDSITELRKEVFQVIESANS